MKTPYRVRKCPVWGFNCHEMIWNLEGKSSLGARLRTRKVTGRDASLPAPLLAASLGLVGRGTVGALPQTPQGTLSLDPARGRRKGTKSPPCPLFAIELVALSYSFRVQLFGASPKPLFASTTFCEEANYFSQSANASCDCPSIVRNVHVGCPASRYAWSLPGSGGSCFIGESQKYVCLRGLMRCS